MVKLRYRIGYPVHSSVSVYVSIDLSPLNPKFWGTLKEFSFLVPPKLGARGRLIKDIFAR
jgi:hypothetical protein